MKAVLLIDFGSTYTKITAVDVDEEKILGTAQSYTTIETDIINGLNNALAILKEKIGDIQFEEQYACSSAAGGLRMVAIGLVPELTAKAARQASLGAGAKVIKTYSYELTKGDLEEIDQTVRRQLNFISAQTMDTVLSAALNRPTEVSPTILTELPGDVRTRVQKPGLRQ